MKSDLDIARSAKPMTIIEVADKLGLASNQLTMYGENIAKIKWECIKSRDVKNNASLILVTSVNPTPFGEGKTVTTIGLNQGLNFQGHKACCVLESLRLDLFLELKVGLRAEETRK